MPNNHSRWIRAGLWLAPLAPLAACHAGGTPDERANHDTPAGEGGQRPTEPPPVDTPPQGYTLTALATGLDFPTAVAFCESENKMWVSESGIIDQQARIVEVDENGKVRDLLATADLAEGMLLPPLTDITYDHDRLWVAHRQIGANGWMVGAISVLDPNDALGSFRTVVTNLPAAGDHPLGDMVLGRDGLLYFTIGSATNSGVVGPDNEVLNMWLAQAPDFRDYPARDVTLSGIEYETDNPLTDDPNDRAITAPYQPFDSGPVEEGALVRAPQPDAPIDGMVAGSGAVYRFDPDATDPLTTLELVAWGLRNPFGLAFDPERAFDLYITNNGADIRGIAGETYVPMQDGDDFTVLEPRPIANDYDDLFLVDIDECGRFFGFPDYVHDYEELRPLPVTDRRFCSADYADIEIDCPQFVLDEKMRDDLVVGNAIAQFDLHSSANRLDISSSDAFGFVGDLFVAETGSFVPITGAVSFVGYRIVIVDQETHEVRNFLSAGSSQEDIFDPDELNKPIDVKFRDDALIVVDFGVFEPGIGLQEPGTGKIWMVTRDEDSDAGEPDEPGDGNDEY